MDFAAWMEVYPGGRWFAFDPRDNGILFGRILIAKGRDAAGVPLYQRPELMTALAPAPRRRGPISPQTSALFIHGFPLEFSPAKAGPGMTLKRSIVLTAGITQVFGPGTLSSFRVWTEEVQ
jgi:hypothetical protein